MRDEIERPKHYQFGQLEAWDVIELAVEGIRDPVTAYHTASALKYLLRAARKGGDTDVAKANAHLKREVARHLPKSPDYDPGIGDAAEHFALNYGFVPGGAPKMGTVLPKTAPEIAAVDGASEYGNPITPGCAVRQSDSWRVSYGEGRS